MFLHRSFHLLLEQPESFAELEVLRVCVDEMAIDTQGFLVKTLPQIQPS
jgi:hypothetical protein